MNTHSTSKIITYFLYLISITALINVPIAVLGQNHVSIVWQKNYGGTREDEPNGLTEGINGGYIIVGQTISNDSDVSGLHGTSDAWVLDVDESGKKVWQKCVGGSRQDALTSVQKTSSGYIAAGITQSNDGDVTFNHGGIDAWVVNMSSTGSIVWQKTYGGSGSDWAVSIATTVDGGYIFSGLTNSTNGDVSGLHASSVGADDAWIVKLDASGNIEWQKCLGGSIEDQGLCIQQTKDSGYIVCGSTTSNDGDVSGYHDSTDIWVVKLNVHGSIQWQKCLGGSGSDVSYSIKQTADGGYVLGGSTWSNNGDITINHGKSDYWVVKLNPMGSISWQKTYGGDENEGIWSIIQTKDGGYITTGNTVSDNGDVAGWHTNAKNLSDEWIIRTDDMGKILWQRCLGGSGQEEGRDIIQITDSTYVTAADGGSNDGDMNNNYGESDYWLVQLRETDTSNVSSVPIIGKTDEITIYPVKTNGTVHVRLPRGDKNDRMRLVDVNGQEIKIEIRGVGTDRAITIPKGTAAGMLILQILTKDGIVSRKIVYCP